MSKTLKTMFICGAIAAASVLLWAQTASAGGRHGLPLGLLSTYDADTSYDTDTGYESYGLYARKLDSEEAAEAIGEAVEAAGDYLGVDLSDLDD